MLEPQTIVAILALCVTALVAAVNFLGSGKREVEEYQKLNDCVESISRGVSEVKDMVNRMDAKLDKHDGKIIRLETQLQEQDKRITKLEGRCERHFGISQHELKNLD